MIDYTIDATMPIKMVEFDQTKEYVHSCSPIIKVKLFSKKTIIKIEADINEFIVDKQVLSIDVIPDGIGYLAKILYIV